MLIIQELYRTEQNRTEQDKTKKTYQNLTAWLSANKS